MNKAGNRSRRRCAAPVVVLSIATLTLGACGGGGGDTSTFADNGLYVADTVNCTSRDVSDGEKNSCTKIVDCLWSHTPDGKDAISDEQWTQIETSIWGPQKYGIAAFQQTRHAHLTAEEAASLKGCDVSLEGSSSS